jgi:hypothetical protein
MQGPFDREIVKQPAMSYFYGSRPGGFAKSKDGMTKQVIDVLKERKQPTDGAKNLLMRSTTQSRAWCHGRQPFAISWSN